MFKIKWFCLESLASVPILDDRLFVVNIRKFESQIKNRTYKIIWSIMLIFFLSPL